MSLRATLRRINSEVEAILTQYSIYSAPLNVEEIAKQIGLNVKPFPFEDGVSGILVIDNGIGTIGYNVNESKVRRRFTIAHELGHYILHREQSKLFLDKNFKIYFRSDNAAENEQNQLMEQQANAFAAALLMPAKILKDEMSKIEFDLGNEEAVKSLAKIFNVSSTAMYYRIVNLELF